MDETGESIFLIPFNLFYYVGFVPFRTTRNKETKRYEIQTHSFQKIICAVIHFLTVIYQFHYVARSCLEFKNNSETNLVAAFEVVSAASFSISAFLVIFNLWRLQKDYLQLLEETRSKVVSKQWKLVNISLVVYFVIWELFSWFLMNDSEHFLGQYYEYLPNSTETLMESDNVTNIHQTSESYMKHYLHYAIYWGYTVTYTHTYSFFVFVQGMFFALAFALRQLGAEFQTKLKHIKEGEHARIEKGLQLYRQLKRTNDFVQEMYGDCLLTCYISFVAYTVEAPHIFLGRRGETEKVIFTFFSVTTIIWILATEFHQRAHHAALEWTTFYSECDSLCLGDRLKMFSIRLEVTTYPLALSCRCFAVTYKHLSSMLGVVVTYGIIVVQLNSD